jgi:tetratricopeptide (TPR) repeat protein
MKNIRRGLTFSAILIIGALLPATATPLFAQMGGSSAHPAPQQQQPPAAQTPPNNSAPAATPAPKIDPAEEADYKAFIALKPEDDDKRIELGNALVQKYPNGHYTEAVYSQLTQADYNKRDFAKMYADSDKALAMNPDDVSVLVITGFVIPHVYNPNDADADAKLDKAEKYEKHALETLATMPKPTTLTDEQFAKTKTLAESQAHSALGLVYFRKQNFEGAVIELTKGTATAASPDPTDYYVMGVSLGHLDRFSDAADAYTKCAAVAGTLQARCKQAADDAKKQAATKPAPPPKP